MELTFDVDNRKGDQVMVALSSYDSTAMAALTDDPGAFDICFYDVSLSRKAGKGIVGYNMLMRIASTLAGFLNENKNAVLCFYCDGRTDINRHHKDIPPQQYRSALFSRMFDMYVRKFSVTGISNYPVIVAAENIWEYQYAHFICRDRHLEVIKRLKQSLVEK